MIQQKSIAVPTSLSKTFAEFFAGIGLVHEGIRGSGWRCVYANDLDPKKRAMYEAHFGEASYYHLEDIWNTGRILQHLRGRPFLATASFPCIDLSLAGHFKGFKGKQSSTYFGFLEALHRMPRRRPRMVMLENVTGFLTASGGRDFRQAIHGLADLGYWIDALVLDARWFVPQSRPRLFVFGYHRSVRWSHLLRQRKHARLDDPWRQAIHDTAMLRPEALRRAMDMVVLRTGWAATAIRPPKQRNYRLADLIDSDENQDWWDNEAVEKHSEMMNDLHSQRVENYVRQGGTAVGTGFRRRRNGVLRLEVRFDGVAGCLRTPRGGSARQVVLAIDKGRLRMRWMTPREYARLQGAGDFAIEVPDNQAMYGFGDAVCVPAIRWIDKEVLSPAFEAVEPQRTVAAS